MSSETLAASFAALICMAALAFQLKSGRAIDWVGTMEVTRAQSPGLYWTYVATTAAISLIFSSIAAAHYVG